MEMPKIDALNLPELPDAAGLFGSQSAQANGIPGSDDTLIVLMVFLYDLYEK